jgi:hypothetical protein
MLGNVSKLSPVPSLAKLSGSKGTPPTSSKPFAWRAEVDGCADFCTKASEEATRAARRAAENLAMIAILILILRRRVVVVLLTR